MRLGAEDWYASLNKPAWTPPDRVFGPVWSVLYLLMAISLWLVWQAGPPSGRGWPITIFAAQLLLNAAWTSLFFVLQSPLAAFVDISLLWIAIVATVAAFGRVKPLAATLLMPYLLWVSLAWTLNLAIWRMNR